jgi:ribosomal protein L29
MAVMRAKEIKALSKTDLMKKLEELQLESIKAVKPSHGSSVKTREVKRTIARLLTKLNNKQYGNMS